MSVALCRFAANSGTTLLVAIFAVDDIPVLCMGYFEVLISIQVYVVCPEDVC